ncbi:hypothetical protein [Thiohalorhabdus sp.]|uniref:hypothetical protein n=1 Tax=Thiohalorhabdus sp. TaxID=3094134 RepID=UPI002FC2A324
MRKEVAEGLRPLSALVSLPPVGYLQDEHHGHFVLEIGDDAVVRNAEAPQALTGR